MKLLTTIFLAGTLALSACSESVTRQVMIIGRGTIKVVENEVTMNDGSGYAEETVPVSGTKAAAWNVTTPAGKTTVNVPEDNGFYILNLKTDTLVGSLQNFGTDLSGGTMTQENLRLKIDSLVKLTTGANLSAGHNYLIVPNQLMKITANTEAKVYGPFNKIPSTLEADKNGKAPEIYKFYTNTEMRELIGKLKKLTY